MPYLPPLDRATMILDPKRDDGSGTLSEPVNGLDATIVSVVVSGDPPRYVMDGVNDLLRVADDPLLDIDNTTPAFTVLVSWHNKAGGDNAMVVGKSPDISASGPGYGLRDFGGDNFARGGSGPFRSDNGGAMNGNRETHGGEFVNDASHSVEAVTNGSLSTTPTTTAWGDASNGTAFTVAANGDELEFVVGDCYGVVLWNDELLIQADIDVFQTVLDIGDVNIEYDEDAQLYWATPAIMADRRERFVIPAWVMPPELAWAA